jgi:hypothetical protein
MPEEQYQRLTWGRRRQLGFIAVAYSRSSLWLGKDHLLAVDSKDFSETYKRFYFRDIQAISLRLTPRRQIWNWVLAVPTALCLAGWAYDLLVTRSVSPGGVVAGVVVTLLFVLPLLVNNLLGPTCACKLRTAVQTEDLPSLGRLRKTRRILDRLRPLIVQAQGQLLPEEIPSRLRAWEAAMAAESAAAAAKPRYGVDDPNLPPRMTS